MTTRSEWEYEPGLDGPEALQEGVPCRRSTAFTKFAIERRAQNLSYAEVAADAEAILERWAFLPTNGVPKPVDGLKLAAESRDLWRAWSKRLAA